MVRVVAISGWVFDICKLHFDPHFGIFRVSYFACVMGGGRLTFRGHFSQVSLSATTVACHIDNNTGVTTYFGPSENNVLI